MEMSTLFNKYNCFLIFLCLLLWNSFPVIAQVDSVVVSVNITYNEITNFFNNATYFRSTYDVYGRLVKYEYSYNQTLYYPGDLELFQYDQNGRMILLNRFDLDGAGNKTMVDHSSWQYDSSGNLTAKSYVSSMVFDSTVYFRDSQGRDTLRISYVSPFAIGKKFVSTYYVASPATSQTEELVFDTANGVWIPTRIDKYIYTSLDSVLTDTVYYYDSQLMSYRLNSLKVFSYDSLNYKILMETRQYSYSSGQFTPAGCESWEYNGPFHQLTSNSKYSSTCGSNNYYSNSRFYDNSGKLTSTETVEDYSSLGCGTVTTDETFYNYDAMGRLSYVNGVSQIFGPPCQVDKFNFHRQYLYAEKGVWTATIIAPQKAIAKCEGLSSTVFSLMSNEPPDAISKWSKNGVPSGTGNSFSFLLNVNEIIGLTAYSPSTNTAVNPPSIIMNVLGSGLYPVLSNGSQDNIEKCKETYLKLENDTSFLNNFKWYLNGSLIDSANGSSAVIVATPGTYRCESFFIASPSCVHTDEIELINVSPDPLLELSGSGIENRKNILEDVNAAPGNLYTWFKNGFALSGVHDNSINISGSGTYYCQVTNSKNCSGRSQDIEVDLFNAVSENEGVWLLNPLHDHLLQVSFDFEIYPPNANCQWRVVDLLGRAIDNGFVNHQNISVKIPAGAGMCFFNVLRNNKVELVKKFLIIE